MENATLDPPVFSADGSQTTISPRFVAPESPGVTIHDVPAESLELIGWFLVPPVASRFVPCPADEYPEATIAPWRYTCKSFRLVSKRFSTVEAIVRGLFYNLVLYTTQESIDRAFLLASYPHIAKAVRCVTFRKPLLSQIFMDSDTLFDKSSPEIGFDDEEIFYQMTRGQSEQHLRHWRKCWDRAPKYCDNEILRGMQLFAMALAQQDEFLRVANLPEQWKKLFSIFKRVNTIVLTGLELESHEGLWSHPVTRNAELYRRLYPGILVYDHVRPIEGQSRTSNNLEFESGVFKAVRESAHLNIRAIIVGQGFALADYSDREPRGGWMHIEHYSPILQLPEPIASKLKHLDLELQATCARASLHDWNSRIYPLLQRCTALESLTLSGCRPNDYLPFNWPTLNLLSNMHSLHFPKLRELALERFIFNPHDFDRFIASHKSTIKYLSLSRFALSFGSGWVHVVLPLLKSVCETARLELSHVILRQPEWPKVFRRDIRFIRSNERIGDASDVLDDELWEWLQGRAEWTNDLEKMWG